MKKKFLFKKDWFFEDFKLPTEPPVFTWCTAIKRKIYSGKSQFQKIDVFDTEEFGRILALDGLVQLSTKHEFVYHEMFVHPAMLYHQKPERILIIGGGDGGALREVFKYPVKEVFLVDIDKKVIDVSRKYLPSVSKGAFNDKRLKIFNKDAISFVKKYKNYFDIVIDDLTDPTGPSFPLWSVSFYKNILQALKENGLAVFQTGYLKERFAKRARKRLKKIFPFFKINRVFVGCFPFDEQTFSFCSKKINFNKVNFETINKKFKKLKIQTKYYSPETHFAAMVLPKYLKRQP